MQPIQLHSYLLWRSTVAPDPQALASRRYTTAVSLIPAIMVGLFVFGWYAGLVVFASLISALVTDIICRRFLKMPSFGSRESAWLLTGLLVGLMLPPNVALWVPILGSAIAMGLGRYFLSVDAMPFLQPATVGLFILFCLGCTHSLDANGRPQWPILNHSIDNTAAAIHSHDAAKLLLDFSGGDIRNSVTRDQYTDLAFSGHASNVKLPQAVHGPRPLDRVKAHPAQDLSVPVAASVTDSEMRQPPVDWLDLLLGDIPAAIGGASTLALLMGILLLIFSGACSWLLPLFGLATLWAGLHFMAWAYGSSPNSPIIAANIPIHLLSGSTLLAFFYLAANPLTAPRSWLGQVYAGVALGVIELLLRMFTPLSEGIFISVLLVQGLSFVIDQWWAPPSENIRYASSHHLTSSALGRL